MSERLPRRGARRATARWALVALAALVAGAVFADDAPRAADDDRVFEDDIEVAAPADDDGWIARASESATRTTTPIHELPQSVQVVTQRLLEDQQIRTLDEALVNVSGVQPARPEEQLLQQPIVRGFPAEVYVDGLQAFGLTPVVDAGSMVHVERVEVLKGPNSTLFGGGIGAPLGGVINVVNKRPLPTAHQRVGVQLGEFDTYGAFFDLNQPLGRRVAVRVTGAFEDADSAIDAVTSRKRSLVATLAARLGRATALRVRAQLSEVDNLEYVGLPAAIALDDRFGIDPFRFSGATDAPLTEIDNLLVTARLDHRFSAALKGVVEARYYDSHFDEFSSFPFFAFFPPDPAQPTVYTLIRGQLPTEVAQHTLSGRLTWTLGEGRRVQHRLLVGVEVDDTDYDVASGFDFNPIGQIDYADPDADLPFGPIPTLNNVQSDTYETIAFTVQDQIAIGDRVDLLAGLRVTRLGVEQRPSFDETYDEVTPRLGVSVDVGRGLRAFAGYAEGFRAVLFFFGANATPPEPEGAEHLEIGLKLDRPDLGLQGTLALYDLTRFNVATPDPNVPFAQVQTGEQRSRGVELDLAWSPSKAWSLRLAYAYADAEIVDDNALPIGDRLPRVPEHSGRVALRYQVQTGPLTGLGVGLGLRATSARDITLPNIDRVDGDALADLQLHYARGSLQLGLSVINLTDEAFYEPYQYLAQSVVIPTRPRTLTATLRWWP
ncbi:MAG: TonB-dependent receptor [Acidobacteriota bacterium]